MLANLRRICPDITIRSTFIVGFPGESETEFEELLAFLDAAELDWVGAFRYSREEGTPAAAMGDQVPSRTIARRYDTLMRAQQAITSRRLQRWVGRETEVLLTDVSGRAWMGRAVNQAPDVDGETLLAPGDLAAAPGDFVRARITGVDGYDLRGQAASVSERAAPTSRSLLQLAVVS